MASFPGTRSTVTTVVAVTATLALVGTGTAGALSSGPADLDTRFAAVVEGERTVEVTGDDELRAALDDAAPGDVIRLAAGSYRPIVITGDGTADAPITLIGPRRAWIRGDDGYAVHVREARHWQLVGFTVRGGNKGVVLDDAQSVLLDSLTVGSTGDEAVHFRSSSSDNTVQRSRIHDTGREQPQYGEGVYVGSAKSNWKRYGEDGGPDLSMRNRVLGNRFWRITAENVDIKEETGGTVVARNRFDGSAVSGKNYADSVVDVKGYGALVVDNVTTGNSRALRNIIETHVITEPATSGCGNTIERNTVQGFEPRGALVAVDRKCD
jgi:hypothetical protein